MRLSDEKGTNVSHTESSTEVRAIRTCLGKVVLGGRLLVLAFSPSLASASRGRIFGGSFGSPGSGAGQLSLAPAEIFKGGDLVLKAGSGLAADQATHDVYVADTGNNRVDQFTSEGVFVRAWGWGVSNGAAEFQTCTVVCQQGLSGAGTGQFEAPVYIAVDNSGGPSSGDVYVSGSGLSVVQKFTAGGALIETWGAKGQIVSSRRDLVGIAVDTAGNLWMATEHTLVEFDQTGTVAKEITQEFSAVGIAFDGSGELYSVQFNKVVKSSSGKELGYLFGPPAPISIIGLAVNTASGELYVDEGKSIAVIAPSCIPEKYPVCKPSGSVGDAQLSGGVGLAVDSGSDVLYAADATVGVVDVFVLEPPSAPKVERESVSAVTGSEATLEAEVNPHGAATTYHFEYGHCTAPTTCVSGLFDGSVPIPDGPVGSDFEVHNVSAQARDLLPNTYYRYRVVATNEIGGELKVVRGEEGIFTTQNLSSFSLPDGRGRELVSPPDKHGAQLLPVGESTVIQASLAGDAISYSAHGPTEAEPAGSPYVTQVLSRRGGSGWESQDIDVPHESATGASVGEGEEYRFFSSDLSLGIVQPFGAFDPSVSSEASEQTAFIRRNFPSGEVGLPCVSSCYRPLVTGAAGFENVPSGTVFGCANGITAHYCGPTFEGGSPDLSHVVLRSRLALVEGAPEGALYEWSDGVLTPISVLPPPSGQLVTVAGDPLGENGVARNAVSTDGSRVVWSTYPNKNLYVRDTALEETVQVGSGPVRFQTASSDGSKILFTAENQNRELDDLRECDIVESEGELHCEIVDLTPVGAGEDPGVLGSIPGASSDASYVYFVSNAVLKNNGVIVPGAQPGACDGNVTGSVTCNLYVRHGGTIRLVAELSGEDFPDFSGAIVSLSTHVSPDGRWLEFMSERSLTGYDNRDSATGRPDEEVYLYDASANGGEGMVVCVSCNPTGARPHGAEDTRLGPDHGGLTGGAARFKADQGIAAIVPGWIAFDGGEHELYEPRYLSDSGRLFFNGIDALIAQDSNGVGDVYEYEPSGVGDCTVSSATFVVAANGCVGLISSGTSKEESAFMDASENGNDVFFLTYAQLSHSDTDSIRDVYDARVGGGFPEASSPPVCEGDACQSPVSAPEDPTPGSLTYNGPGNPSPLLSPTAGGGKHRTKAFSAPQKLAKALAACKRVRSRRARGVCVSRARRRYGQARTGSATTKRGKQ